ncbi:DapH/DapD/GlmU-related protein [Weissella koreensis]|uniref:DapH/DapD/GlmU-related protein n=1 Tax=Weissella koreensis TaxID=165096 RepID=UPI000CF30D77|nr:DapH/DapD/GlmU-related protein [Weissella koreensis]AVH74666.1 acetyltransferase [Weissella koreensis]
MEFTNKIISANSSEFNNINEIKTDNEILIQQLNTNVQSPKSVREKISIITNSNIDETVEINLPFQTDYGANIRFGKNVFVNKNAMFVDVGGIVIDDNVLIAPNVTIVSVNHAKDPNRRRDLELEPVHIKENAWIGANSTITPGVTIGKNAIVGAGSVVTHDVADDSTVVGVPARLLS